MGANSHTMRFCPSKIVTVFRFLQEAVMRVYKRKTDRQSWSEDSMKAAIEAYLSREFGYLRAATHFQVARSTLRDRVKMAQRTGQSTTESATKGFGRFKIVFSHEQEEELVSHILEMEKKLFGLSINKLRKLAYQLAQINGLQHKFNNMTREAGKTGLRGF